MRSWNKALRPADLRSRFTVFTGMDRLASSSISILDIAIIIG